jgi:hypothetical protein
MGMFHACLACNTSTSTTTLRWVGNGMPVAQMTYSMMPATQKDRPFH